MTLAIRVTHVKSTESVLSMRVPVVINDDEVTALGQSAAYLLATIRQEILFRYYYQNQCTTIQTTKQQISQYLGIPEWTVKRLLNKLSDAGYLKKEVARASYDYLKLSLNDAENKSIQKQYTECMQLFEMAKKEVQQTYWRESERAPQKVVPPFVENCTPVLEKWVKTVPPFAKNCTPVSNLVARKRLWDALPKQIQWCLIASTYDISTGLNVDYGIVLATLYKSFISHLLIFFNVLLFDLVSLCTSLKNPPTPLSFQGGISFSFLTGEITVNPQEELESLSSAFKGRLKTCSGMRQLVIPFTGHNGRNRPLNAQEVDPMPVDQSLQHTHPYLYRKLHGGADDCHVKLPEFMTVGANGSTSYTSRSDVQPVIVEYVSELLLDAFPNLQLNQHRIIDTLNQVLADYDVACAVRYGVTNSFSNPCNKILSFLLNRYQLPGRTKDLQYDPIDWYVYDYCYLQIKNHMSGYGVSYFRDLFDYKDEQKKVKTACTLFQLAYSEVVSLRSYLDWCYKNNKSTLEDILSKQQLNLYMRGHVTSEQSSLEEEDQ